ncbi:HK97 gp10 family phage protein [Brevibacillus agri]|uniref:HK97 gp10 family phage protein n=1 Tax=Brevibacillus agri TaxID=51101 RepID=UPI00286FC38D|nr:HK97 gp10 family phage protein [Brevibacillus agri]MDR9504763.1 HK97 gp10 family phage protein [Brevibacillus agri]
MATVNKKDLERQYRRLKKQSKREVEAAMDRVARKAGFQVLRGAQDRAPVRDGVLRESLMIGNPDNIFELILRGTKAEITVGTHLEYARYVEEGFTQRKGQFVPGYWDKEKFIYAPDHPSGMVLKGKRIPGVHYLARSEAEVESVMDELVKEELDELARRLFPNG